MRLLKAKQGSLLQQEVPGSIGKLEDDLVLQIIDLAQPAVIGYVVTIHERLQKQERKPCNYQPLYFDSHGGSPHMMQPKKAVSKGLDSNC